MFCCYAYKNVLVGECLPLRKTKIVFATAKSNSGITCRGLIGGVNVSIAIYIRRLKEVTWSGHGSVFRWDTVFLTNYLNNKVTAKSGEAKLAKTCCDRRHLPLVFLWNTKQCETAKAEQFSLCVQWRHCSSLDFSLPQSHTTAPPPCLVLLNPLRTM